MLLAPLAVGQRAAGVEAEVDRATVYLGDAVTYTISVVGSQQVEPVSLSRIEGATVAFRGQSQSLESSFVDLNGRVEQRQVLRTELIYEVRPTRAGRLLIPSQSVRVDGVERLTPLLEVSVLEPATAPRGTLSVELDSAEIYAGQTVGFRIIWRTTDPQRSQQPSFVSSALPDGLRALLAEVPRQNRRPSLLTATVFDTPTVATFFPTRDGSEYQMVIEGDLAADATGRYTIDRIEAVYGILDRFNRVLPHRAVADPVTLEVRPLPEEGRPDGFNGLIGLYAISSEATPTRVNLGDPITLRVEITGQEPMAAVKDGPELSSTPGFVPAFRLSTEGWAFRPTEPNRRVFETTVRVADPQVTQLPAIELPFFDPGTRTYRVARTSPIPLDVVAVKEVTAADALVAAGGNGPAPKGQPEDEPIRPTGAGLWAIQSGPSVLAVRSFDLLAEVGSPGVLAALIAPPLAFAALAVGLGVRRTIDPVMARRRAALGASLRALRRTGPEAAVKLYLAMVFDQPAESLTVADGERLLGGVHLADAQPLAELLGHAEARRYGGVGMQDVDAATVRDLLRRTDRQIRGAR